MTPVNHVLRLRPPIGRGRDFVVGDLHGMDHLLDRLLSKVGFNPNRDRLLALGDLIDREPGSVRLLNRVAENDWFYSLLGNHEEMMIQSQQDPQTSHAWYWCGNKWARDLEVDLLDRFRSVASQFPIAIEVELRDGRRIGLVHAEVDLNSSWTELASIEHATPDRARQLRESALYGRDRAMVLRNRRTWLEQVPLSGPRKQLIATCDEPVAGIDRIYSGHTVLGQGPRLPESIGNVMMIETGAYMAESGRLTMVDLLDEIYWQAGNQGPEDVIGPIPLPPLYSKSTFEGTS